MALFNLSSHKGALSYDESYVLESNERSEVKFRYHTKTTQENLYQKLLKLIRENMLKFN